VNIPPAYVHGLVYYKSLANLFLFFRVGPAHMHFPEKNFRYWQYRILCYY